MEVNSQYLGFFERNTLRQLLKAKLGNVTVREAREHCSPTGTALVVQTIGVTLLCVAVGLVFLPFIFVALLAPVVVPLQAMQSRKRWQKILPADRDDETVVLV